MKYKGVDCSCSLISRLFLDFNISRCTYSFQYSRKSLHHCVPTVADNNCSMYLLTMSLLRCSVFQPLATFATSDISLNSPFIRHSFYYARCYSSQTHDLEALEHELTVVAENTVTAIGWSVVSDTPNIMDMTLSSLLGWRTASRLRVSDQIHVTAR